MNAGVTRCASCGSTNLQSAGFCTRCGTALRGGAGPLDARNAPTPRARPSSGADAAVGPAARSPFDPDLDAAFDPAHIATEAAPPPLAAAGDAAAPKDDGDALVLAERASVEDELQAQQEQSAHEIRFRPGDRILQYVVVRQLGRGGMGTVLLARDPVSEQEVAIKVLPAALARERDIRDRFIQEARALASLDHKNIVPLISFAEENEDRFLVMKYVRGEPLDARIRSRRMLEPDEARLILRPVLEALGYAHARGVIHRDIKPSNVIIEGDLKGQHRVFLVDFGIAKKEQGGARLTETGMLMGTPQYMSPEQISGYPVDGRSDLYAAGLVLFEMLTGQPPFDSQKTFEVLRAHVESPVPDVRVARGGDVPDDLVGLMTLLLKKDPNNRPKDAAQAVAYLDGALALPTPPPTAPETPRTGMHESIGVGAPLPRVVRDGPLPTGMAPRPAPGARPFVDEPPPSVGAVLHGRDGGASDDLDDVRLPSRRGPFLVAALVVALIGAGVVYRHDVARMMSLAADAPPEPDREDAITVSLLLAKARIAYEQKRLEDARILVDAALDQEPDNTGGLALRASILIEGGALDDADAAIGRLLGAPNLSDADRTLALSLTASVAAARTEEPQKLEAPDTATGAPAKKKRRRLRPRRTAAVAPDAAVTIEDDRPPRPNELSADVVLAITGKTGAAMSACYSDHVLQQDPEAEGEVAFNVRVAPSGKVDDVDLPRNAFKGNAAFTSCVIPLAKRWTFPEFEGDPVRFTHPITFRVKRK